MRKRWGRRSLLEILSDEGMETMGETRVEKQSHSEVDDQGIQPTHFLLSQFLITLYRGTVKMTPASE